KGKNRVRAYEDGKGGALYLEWYELVFDKQGIAVNDLFTGKQKGRRMRLSLTAAGINSRADAIKKAEEVAQRFGQLPARAAAKVEGPLTLGRLLSLYLAEVVPTKRAGTQRHNRIMARIVLAFFGEGSVVERIGPDGRPTTEIGRVRYNAFLRARAEGTIPGFPQRARPQTVRLAVTFMRSVFNWAKIERDDGCPLLMRNPWEGFPIPREDTPTRPEMTAELHTRLVEHAADWRMGVVLDLCRETRRRMNSVRQLALEDVDLAAGTVRWRGEFDKARKTRVTPLSTRARAAILRALERRRAEGLDASPWLLPAKHDASQPVGKNVLHNLMKLTKRRLGINVARLGYHAEKRAGIRDPRFRALPPKVQEELAGTTWDTMRKVYDYVDLPTLHDAVAALEADPAPLSQPPAPVRHLRSVA
ncbi:MAG TPA: tyrosine-type recombinase/integrase, partial [Longimicrobium sp.]|nr:tyrosine-type recombinase/integrase [Longimicrobium sp.]